MARNLVLPQDENMGIVAGGVKTEDGGGRLVNQLLHRGKVRGADLNLTTRAPGLGV